MPNKEPTIRDENGWKHVSYFGNDIVSFNEKSVVLRTCGWPTKLTMSRMNDASTQFNLGYCISAKKFEWIIKTAHSAQKFATTQFILNRWETNNT